MSKVFIVVAVVFFVLSAFGIGHIGPIQLLPLGLGFLAGSSLV